ncbi:family S53 protease [Auriscalpium vulgare]|uniref:Family S53 protease n=1 Tax=Auriscalpium vulgare TaxID=40419 RepID=A0ACB8RQQ7_9AGAM|nr:family S53 protease [Auriscalpium vulgare]
MRLHEHRDHVPSGFTNKGPAPGDTVLKLRIALKQTDITGLQDVLMDVSTPSSAHYGQHLSLEEVNRYVEPKPETIAIVNEWLSANGLTAKTLSPAGDWLGFQTTVSHANELFDTRFDTFVHDASGAESIRTLAYSIPASLKGHLDLVHPTITFTSPQRAVVSSPLKFKPTSRTLTADASAPSCDSTAVTPACLQALYGIPTALATASPNNITVTGYIGQYAQQADLKQFLIKYRSDLLNNTTFVLRTIDNGTNPQNASMAGVEADLDIQYTVGLANGIPVTFLSAGNSYRDGALDGFLDTVNYLLTQPTSVVTTSYGFNEEDISFDLADKLCNAYVALGALGTSVLFASGDGGVTGSQYNPLCINDVPTFPAGCPFITTVGATQNVNPETAAEFSSGGFSNYFAQPDYQKTAVSQYLTKLGTTRNGRFNESGRGFPDVSAAGRNFNIVYKGNTTTVSGTSCSSPTFASIVSLLNDRRIDAGKKPLGFLNPFLYNNTDALNDITSGSNYGCVPIISPGFPAMEGWDPVTGLGTPNFAKLVAAVDLLPN